MEQSIKKSVLTVNDSPALRQMICFTLSEEGYDVIQAANGIEAVEKMNIFQFDFIITDLKMPILDGIELIRYARANPVYRFVPILMLVNESQQVKIIEGKYTGTTGWIVKPFTSKQLIDAVTKMMRQIY